MQSLKFMPDEIKDIIEPKINEFFEIHDKNIKEEIKALDNEVEKVIRTNIDPLKFANDYLIKYKGYSINSELNKEIRKYLRTKVTGILTKINDSLNENKVD